MARYYLKPIDTNQAVDDISEEEALALAQTPEYWAQVFANYEIVEIEE